MAAARAAVVALASAGLLLGCARQAKTVLPDSVGPFPERTAAELCAGLGAPALSVLHHSVVLSIASDGLALRGSADVWIRALQAVPLIALDAADLEIAKVSAELLLGDWGKGRLIESGIPAHTQKPLQFETAAGRLCIDRGLDAGQTVRLHLEYGIGAEHATGRPAPKFQSGQVWAGYQTAAWLPTLQDPAQRASLDLRVEAPAGWKVASGPHPLEAAPFLYGWAAGQFDEHTLEVDGVTLRALGPPGAHLAAVNALTAPMLRFMKTKTGANPPAATYTQVFVQGDAAQEAAGLSLLSADSIAEVEKDPTEDWIFIHELSHQWFGWLVPCADFADFWLNEGFATFMVAAYKEEKWGRAAYEREVALWRARSDKVHAAGKDAPLSLSGPGGPFPPAARGAPPRRGPQDSELQARGVTYSRGALLLDKLRCDLGDAVFWDGIRRYVKAGQGAAPGSGGVRSEDLRRALEAASGRDLKPLWAERVYAPYFDWSVSSPCASPRP